MNPSVAADNAAQKTMVITRLLSPCASNCPKGRHPQLQDPGSKIEPGAPGRLGGFDLAGNENRTARNGCATARERHGVKTRHHQRSGPGSDRPSLAGQGSANGAGSATTSGPAQKADPHRAETHASPLYSLALRGIYNSMISSECSSTT